jgi:hypothetical protein
MIRICVVALALLPVAGALQAQQTPYAGLERRAIKALSEERMAALMAGEGAGYALAAELNGYPGPRHVLDLADSLHLTEKQRTAVADVFERMQEAARALGQQLVAGEAALDSAFAGMTITPERLRESLEGLAALEGELRGVHLAAHLEVTTLLSQHQRGEYGRLRGYAGGHGEHHDGS